MTRPISKICTWSLGKFGVSAQLVVLLQEKRRLVYGCTVCKEAWWQKPPDGWQRAGENPERTPCCGNGHILQFVLPCSRGPLKLNNQHLPVTYSGGPRNDKIINISNTTYYNSVGAPDTFPRDMEKGLESVLKEGESGQLEETL